MVVFRWRRIAKLSKEATKCSETFEASCIHGGSKLLRNLIEEFLKEKLVYGPVLPGLTKSYPITPVRLRLLYEDVWLASSLFPDCRELIEIMLFKMLLEPSLPAAVLLNPEDATLLHKALYDDVILVEYSFYSGRWVQSSESYSKKLALVWVLITERAIQFARATIDEDRAKSYIHAFCQSQLVAELIKWVSNQAGMVDQGTRPEISTPKTLINSQP